MAAKANKIVVSFALLLAIALSVSVAHARNKCIFDEDIALKYSLAHIKECAQDKPAYQNLLAYLYNSGVNVKKDQNKALLWYKRAAENNYPSAMFNLGNMYFDGKGIAVDYKNAFFWYEKAAKSGDIQGQHNLAYMYGKGLGTRKDLVRSYAWFFVAMKQGHEASFASANALLEPLGKKGFEEGVEYGKELFRLYGKKKSLKNEI